MTDDDWTSGHARSVAVYLNGEGIPDRDDLGERVVNDSFLLLINAHHEPVTFLLPDASYVRTWEVAVDTADPLLAYTRRRRPAPGGRRQAAHPGLRPAGSPGPLIIGRRSSCARPDNCYRRLCLSLFGHMPWIPGISSLVRYLEAPGHI